MSACQKEISSEDTTPGIPDPIPAQPLLKRYIRVDTTLAPPNDTIMVADFYYDN